jgi:multicomponent Na+:H+ antiporter subunit B
VSRRARIALFALAGPGFTAVLVIGLLGLPAFGNYHGVYGLVVIGTELGERHATDLVTALNFDLRAFDTLGEEFILFASVTGVVLLLRQLRGEDENARADDVGQHNFAGASEALRVLSIALVALLVAFGGYVIVHGTLTPGGGFQGGVVLGAGPVAALLAGRYLAVKAITPDPVLEAVDAIGAAGYALFGLGGLLFAGVYLKNFLPLGIPGHLLSGGFMPLNSIAVGIEVAGGFLLIWTEFLDQALVVRAGDGQAARA